MRDYELSVVIRPDLDDKQSKAAADRVQSLVTRRGGEFTNVQEWGKRRLAYKISHHTEGTYFVYRLRMEPSAAAEIEHELNLDEQVLRFIMVYLDPVALEALKNPPPPMAPRPERRAPETAEASEAQAAMAVPGNGESEAAAEASAAAAEAAPEDAAMATTAEEAEAATEAEAAPEAEVAPAAEEEPARPAPARRGRAKAGETTETTES